MPPRLTSLPIDAYLAPLLIRLAQNPNLILKASPGSGKTTRVPAALLEADFARGGEVLVLEPRRLAAKMAAERVADELGSPIGDRVGYQFRFENRVGPKTRLKFLTEGTFLKRFLSDPELRGVAAVVLDEFHERHLHTDVALSLLRALQKSRRPDLRIVVMSATMQTTRLETFLAAPVLEIEAPRYPVEIEYLLEAPRKNLEILVRQAVEKITARFLVGDILVFLPGLREIRRSESELLAFAKSRQMDVCFLHGSLTREEQSRAVTPGPRRKIILATNLAESSVTIEGVTAVIDGGLHRQALFSWWSGIPQLKTTAISRASAVQRTGRAGRLGPGFCQRLFTKADFDGRIEFDKAEIERVELSQAALELTATGLFRAADFEWFASPPPAAWNAATQLLESLGALHNGEITELGRRMAQLPLHPRLSRFLLAGATAGLSEEALDVVLYLSEGNFTDLDLFDDLASYRPGSDFVKMKQQLQRGLGDISAVVGKWTQAERHEKIAQALLRAFPDRVAMRRGDAAAELLFSSGGFAKIKGTVLPSGQDYFVVLDVQEVRDFGSAPPRSEIRSLVPIQEKWLFDVENPGVREESELEWDDKRARVQKTSRLLYDKLKLFEAKETIGPGDTGAAFALFLSAAFRIDRNALRDFPDFLHAVANFVDAAALETTLRRLEIYAEHFPADFAQPWTLESFFSQLGAALAPNFSVADFRDLPFHEILPGHFLIPSALARFEKRLPTGFNFRVGRRSPVHYRFGQEPWLESRLQDFFGMREGPYILDGRQPLLLHLLAPNFRPVQVTKDLAGFWDRAYQEIRGQLSRRYPRHAWPEDPKKLLG